MTNITSRTARKAYLYRFSALQAISSLSLLVFASPAFARAGGGGGGGGGGAGAGGVLHAKGGWIVLVIQIGLLGIGVITWISIRYFVAKKSEEAKEVMLSAAVEDPAWETAEVLRRIEEIFFKVQIAWMERDQSIAKEWMSEKLFEKHKKQTDQMVAEHRKNILKKMKLLGAKVVEARDFPGGDKDSMWVYIEGSMVDYTVDDRTNRWAGGGRLRPVKFEELWKLVRAPHGWVLDEIKPVEDFELEELSSFRQSVPPDSSGLG